MVKDKLSHKREVTSSSCFSTQSYKCNPLLSNPRKKLQTRPKLYIASHPGIRHKDCLTKPFNHLYDKNKKTLTAISHFVTKDETEQ